MITGKNHGELLLLHLHCLEGQDPKMHSHVMLKVHQSDNCPVIDLLFSN